MRPNERAVEFSAYLHAISISRRGRISIAEQDARILLFVRNKRFKFCFPKNYFISGDRMARYPRSAEETD
jgi:hypothetical protein